VDESTLEFVAPWVFQGTNYGFSSGGGNEVADTTDRVDRFAFSSSSGATDVGDLSVARQFPSGSS
jgi:hypothetical protein